MKKFLLWLLVLLLLSGAAVWWFFLRTHTVTPAAPSEPTASEPAIIRTCTCAENAAKAKDFSLCVNKKITDAKNTTTLNTTIRKKDGGSYTYQGKCCFSAALVAAGCVEWPTSGPTECATLTSDPLVASFIEESKKAKEARLAQQKKATDDCTKTFPDGFAATQLPPCTCASFSSAMK